MQRGNIGESATWTHDRKRGPEPAPKEEKTRIPLCRFGLLLCFCVEVIENPLPSARIIDHPIQGGDHVNQIYLGVVREQRADFAQVYVDVRIAIIPRQDQTAKARKSRMRDDIADCAVNAQMTVSNLHSGRVRVAGCICNWPCGTLLICTRISGALEQRN
jgi:hypothetical protein